MKNQMQYWDHDRAEWRPKYKAAQAENRRRATRRAQQRDRPSVTRRLLISTRIPIELWDRLEKYIEQHGQTKQWLITRALDVYLREWEKK
jgi:hypothetical protein